MPKGRCAPGPKPQLTVDVEGETDMKTKTNLKAGIIVVC